MAGFRFSVLKSLSPYIKPSSKTLYFRPYDSCGLHARASFAFANHNYHTLQSRANAPYYRTNHADGLLPTLSNFYLRSNVAIISASPALSYRSYASFFGDKGDKPSEPEAPAASDMSGLNIDEGGIIPSDWVDKIGGALNSVADAAAYTAQKIKEVSNEMTPHVQQLLDSHPYLNKVIIPVGYTLAATVMAWVVMPRLLRRFHKYAMQGPAALLPGGLFGGQTPYEKSFWGALEDPVRYLITFMAFSQIGMMIAPTTIASEYIPQAWRGAVVLSFVWFLNRWKTNVFSRALTVENMLAIDREKLLTLDKLSSVGLCVLGLMALAEACGVAVQSILTVGGIGGVATAFAARDVLGNVLSGLSLQFSKLFSLGDTIKAGSIEGQIVEMGLTTTSLLNAEKLPVIVPNSLFSSQVIVNKSRAEWRAVVTKIPLQIDCLEKVPPISADIKIMLKSNSKVFLGMEAPYCFLSRIECSFAELTLGCNLKNMSKDEWYSTQQDILIQSVRIIQQHGASLGSTSHDLSSQ